MRLATIPNGGQYCPDDPGEPGGGQRITVTDKEGKALAALVRKQRVLEIGTGLGVSTKYMASTAAIVYTCDIDPWVRENVWPELEEVGYIVCIDDPHEAKDVSIAFIDGEHTEEQVNNDIEVSLEMGCTTIIGHDMNSDFVKKAFKNHFGAVNMVKTEYGLGIAFDNDLRSN